MSAIKDRTGQRFGRLTVIRDVGRTAQGNRNWECRCDCGSVLIVKSGSLGSGNTQSCGCLQRERTGDAGRRHGLTGTRTYVIWQNVLRRIDNPKNPTFRYYGARGIKVCDRWLSFEAFLADMGECPTGLTIERIDNNGNYDPTNCRWATHKDQQNNRRNNRIITYDGETFTLTQLADIFGFHQKVLAYRIRKGWPENRWPESLRHWPVSKKSASTIP